MHHGMNPFSSFVDLNLMASIIKIIKSWTWKTKLARSWAIIEKTLWSHNTAGTTEDPFAYRWWNVSNLLHQQYQFCCSPTGRAGSSCVVSWITGVGAEDLGVTKDLVPQLPSCILTGRLLLQRDEWCKEGILHVWDVFRVKWTGIRGDVLVLVLLCSLEWNVSFCGLMYRGDERLS